MNRVRVLIAMFCLALPGAAFTGAAAGDSLPRFRLVTGEHAAQLERRLQSSSAEGYSLVAVAEGTDLGGKPRITGLMERAGDGSLARDYEVVGCSGNLRDEATRKVLAGLGEQGYSLHPRGITVRKIRDHWLPGSVSEDQMTLVLERAADGSRYAFDSLAFGDHEPFYRDLSQRRSEGYRVAGMWSTGRRLQVVLERRSGEGETRSPPPAEHRLLIMATRLVLAGKLKTAAGDGFRLLAADDPTITGPPLMLLERTDAPGSPVEYKFLDDVPVKQSKDELQNKLNAKARKGWRVARRGTTPEVITLQRPARKPERVEKPEYLLLSSRRAPGLPASLEDATSRGFEFVRLFVESDETTVLLEKIAPISPAPR